ncbi:MAG TPA: glycosyltransferase [Bacteroidia bacterium]|nr:glycosyltransferase [Bacteroidia bacterium]
MKTKKNILVFADWYLPAYKAGGPVKSIAALVFYLKDDFNFYIITSDKDLFATEPHKGIKSNEWNVLPNGEHVFYFSDDFLSFKNLRTVIEKIEYNCVYLNSFFSKRFTIYPLLLKKLNIIKTPILLAPRGMLGGGALSLKAGKKNMFIKLAKATGLYKHIIWHATSLQEEKEIKQLFTHHIKTISNLILPPVKNRTDYSKTINELKICFVSRIAQKKNLLFALEVLQTINAGKIVFDVYGPAEEGNYYAQCIELAKKLPNNISVNFKGDLQGDEVEQTLKNYHLFFLPTLNENFGHAIVEAMLNGCIPLISNATPWRNLKAKNIGWDIALNEKEKFATTINEVLQLSQADFELKSKAVQQYALTNCIDSGAIEAYKSLFNSL